MSISSSAPQVGENKSDIRTLSSKPFWKGAGTRPAPSARNSFLFVLALYVLLMSVTSAIFMADTTDYVRSVVARLNGRYDEFLEFGHLLWRPLGWAVVRIAEWFKPSLATSDFKYNVTLVLIGIGGVSGFVALYFLHRLASSATKHFWMASLVAAGFATSQGFLNFIHAGTAYIPGLAMLVVAVYALGKGDDTGERPFMAVLGGAAMAASVLLWFPYVLVLPAVVLMPTILRGAWRSSLVSAITVAVVCGIVYGAIAWSLGLHTIPQVLAWIRASNHGIDQIKGVSRVIFGFSRSFINMDKDGILFKRYLLHDPFSPVSLMDLIRLSLGKLVLFYVWLASIIIALIVTKQRRALVLLATALVPVLGFAVNWQGGDIERYLAAYPFLFFAIAIALKNHPPRSLGYVMIGFIAIILFVNASALLRSRVNRHENEVAQRLQEIPSNMGGRIFVTHNQDDVFNFLRSFPSAPLNRNRTFQISAVFELGHVDTGQWRTSFARLTTQLWSRGDRVWLSKRLFSPLPKPEWNWVEGQDRRVSWKELSPFFSAMEVGMCVGGDDGFCLLPASQANREFLQKILNGSVIEPQKSDEKSQPSVMTVSRDYTLGLATP